MEELYNNTKEVVDKMAETGFTLFKRRHETRLKDTPSIAKRINEDALFKVTSDPCFQMKEAYTKEVVLEGLTLSESTLSGVEVYGESENISIEGKSIL